MSSDFCQNYQTDILRQSCLNNFSCLFSSEGCARTGSSALHLPVDPVLQRMRGVALFCRRCGEGQTSPAACSTHNKEARDLWHQQVQESGRTGRQGMEKNFLFVRWSISLERCGFFFEGVSFDIITSHTIISLKFYNIIAFLLIFDLLFSSRGSNMPADIKTSI